MRCKMFSLFSVFTRTSNRKIYCFLVSATIAGILFMVNYETPGNVTRQNITAVQNIRTFTDVMYVRGTLDTTLPQPANCRKIVTGGEAALGVAMNVTKMYTRKPLPDEEFVNLASDCQRFQRERGYIMDAASQPQDEREYPIAYSILIYHYVEQVEHLLRAIYRPQNIYCIHVDRNADESVLRGMKSITNCFPNVFIASVLESVLYGGYTLLQAHLNCMKDAVEHDVTWKYLINLSGEMYPLKTNGELVKILKIYNGSNDICGMDARQYSYRWNYKYRQDGKRPQVTKIKNSPPPHGIQLVKGTVYGAYTREFLHFALNHPVAKDFLNWTKVTRNPEETFFATLHNAVHNPHLNVPGSYKGNYTKNKCMAVCVRWNNKVNNPCPGLVVRGVCIPDIRDLKRLVTSRKLFVNKLLPYQNDHLIMDCLEEWIVDRTRNNYTFDVSMYYQLPFVKERAETRG